MPADIPLSSDSIAALASAGGQAPIAIIRISGARCHEQLASTLTPVEGPHRNWQRANYLALASFYDHEHGMELDRPMAVFFMAPHSYTGENSVELYFHGSPYILKRAFAELQRLGIRMAEPGEFSLRRFLHGKLDLLHAEGINALIQAETEQEWLAAQHLTSGALSTRVHALRHALLDAAGYLAAQIDFPDEGDTAHATLRDVDQRVTKVHHEIATMKATYSSGHVVKDGLRIVFAGAPNAGKSTLLNALLGYERAIVSTVPGTTRDYVEERLILRGRLLRLVDTAGIRLTADAIEEEGVKRSLALAQQADVVLYLISAENSLAQWQSEWSKAQQLTALRVVAVTTKADLGTAHLPAEALAISATTPEGWRTLEDQLVAWVDESVLQARQNGAFIVSLRHYQALEHAERELEDFATARTSGESEEILAFYLQNAIAALTAIVGEVGADDVLDVVFRSFCVGK